MGFVLQFADMLWGCPMHPPPLIVSCSIFGIATKSLYLNVFFGWKIDWFVCLQLPMPSSKFNIPVRYDFTK